MSLNRHLFCLNSFIAVTVESVQNFIEGSSDDIPKLSNDLEGLKRYIIKGSIIVLVSCCSAGILECLSRQSVYETN